MTNIVKSAEEQAAPGQDRIALLLILIAVSMFSLAPIFIKISEQEISPNGTIFNRFWITTLILGLWKITGIISGKIFNKISEPQEPVTRGDIKLFVLAAGFGAANLTTWAWSLTQTSIANSNLLHNMTPFFTTVGAWLFFKQSFDSKFIMGLTLALVGAVVLGIEDLQIDGTHLMGDALALLSAVFYTGHVLSAEKLRAKFSATTIVLWSCLFRSFWMLPIIVLFDEKVFPSSVNGWLAVIALALFCQVLATVIIFHNLKRFSSGFVSLFLLFDPIITAILSWVIFAEELSMINWLAFLTVLVGIYLAKTSRGSEKATDR